MTKPAMMTAKPKMTNSVGSAPFWLGYSLDFWDWASSKLLIAAVITGIFAAVASGLSSWISSGVTAQVQDMAGHRIAAAELELQESRERTAGLEASVAEANARAAEANRVAEGERLARIRIEAGLASRRLSSEQASKLISTLRSAKDGVSRVNITLLGEQEAQIFGADIARAIQSAGISIAVTRVGMMTPPPYGLLVTDTPAGTLKAALDAAGVPAEYNPATSAIPDILVGLKAPAF